MVEQKIMKRLERMDNVLREEGMIKLFEGMPLYLLDHSQEGNFYMYDNEKLKVYIEPRGNIYFHIPYEGFVYYLEYNRYFTMVEKSAEVNIKNIIDKEKFPVLKTMGSVQFLEYLRNLCKEVKEEVENRNKEITEKIEKYLWEKR